MTRAVDGNVTTLCDAIEAKVLAREIERAADLGMAAYLDDCRGRFGGKWPEPWSYFILRNGKRLPMKAVMRAALQETGLNRHINPISQVHARAAQKFNLEVEHIPSGTVQQVRRSERELIEERERVKRIVEQLSRSGQAKFRAALFDRDRRCVLSGTETPKALDAAHILEVHKSGRDNIGNGLLLRKDLHALFDYGLLAIHPDTGDVELHPEIAKDYEGKIAPRIDVSNLDRLALEQRYETRKRP